MEKHHPNDPPEINENEGNCQDVGSWWGHAAAGNSVFLLEALHCSLPARGGGETCREGVLRHQNV